MRPNNNSDVGWHCPSGLYGVYACVCVWRCWSETVRCQAPVRRKEIRTSPRSTTCESSWTVVSVTPNSHRHATPKQFCLCRVCLGGVNWIFSTTQDCRRQKIWSLNVTAIVQFTPPHMTKTGQFCCVWCGGVTDRETRAFLSGMRRSAYGGRNACTTAAAATQARQPGS